MSLEAGGAFTCNDEELTQDTQHLWVIISDTAAYPDSVVVVNVSSSINATYDSACDLRQGDHAFITHRSFVYYRRAQLLTAEQLKSANISYKTSVTPNVLGRIREGAGKTNRISHQIKKVLIEL